MEEYKIVFKKSVQKDLSKIPKKDVKRIVSTIKLLAKDPRPVTAKRLSAREHYRIRQGNYRILYSIEDDKLVVCVVKIGHRQAVYR